MPAEAITSAASILIEAIQRYTDAVTADPTDRRVVDPLEVAIERAAATYDEAVYAETGVITPFVTVAGDPDTDDAEGDLDLREGLVPDSDELEVQNGDQVLTGDLVTLVARYDFLVTDPDAVMALAEERRLAASSNGQHPDEGMDEPTGAVLELYLNDRGWDPMAYADSGLVAVEETVSCGPFEGELPGGDEDDEDDEDEGPEDNVRPLR